MGLSNSDDRKNNIISAYTKLIHTEEVDPDFESFIKQFHLIALDDWDLTQLSRYKNSNPNVQSIFRKAKSGEYRNDSSFGYTSIITASSLQGIYDFYTPNSQIIPIVIEGIKYKYEKLLQVSQNVKHPNSFDPFLISAWAMTQFTILHPFYDGNGRVARSILPYTLRRANQEPLYVENVRKTTHSLLDETLFNEIEELLFQTGLSTRQEGLQAALIRISNVPKSMENIHYYQNRIGSQLKFNIESVALADIRKNPNYNTVAEFLTTMSPELI